MGKACYLLVSLTRIMSISCTEDLLWNIKSDNVVDVEIADEFLKCYYK